jgi:predicted nucleic acid-binding protein
MTSYYLDSSVLAKLYIAEPGSQWMLTLFNAVGMNNKPVNHLAFSKIGIVEVAAAISKRMRMQQITPEKRDHVFRSFLADCNTRFKLLGLTDQIIYLAAELTQRSALRGYDAVHLAAALVLNQQLNAARLPELIFISADHLQCQVAIAEGLSTENPSQYP